MSGSSPESGEFAAKNRMGLGFAFTTLPMACDSANYYREQCVLSGWEPTPEDVIYRVGFYVAETDEEAWEDVVLHRGGRERIGLSMANKAVEGAVGASGYYGRDIVTQRARLTSRGELKSQVEKGQMLLGGPDTVLEQIRTIRDELGAGILDLSMGAQMGDKTLRSIELFGEKVLPKMHEL